MTWFLWVFRRILPIDFLWRVIGWAADPFSKIVRQEVEEDFDDTASWQSWRYLKTIGNHGKSQKMKVYSIHLYHQTTQLDHTNFNVFWRSEAMLSSASRASRGRSGSMASCTYGLKNQSVEGSWRMDDLKGLPISSRRWFQKFFIFTPTWRRFPFWQIFFRWVETTN